MEKFKKVTHIKIIKLLGLKGRKCFEAGYDVIVVEKPTSIAEPLDLPEGLTARPKTINRAFGFAEEDQLKLGTWLGGIALVFKLISPSRETRALLYTRIPMKE